MNLMMMDGIKNKNKNNPNTTKANPI